MKDVFIKKNAILRTTFLFLVASFFSFEETAFGLDTITLNKVPLTGEIYFSSKEEISSYDLIAGNQTAKYVVKGSTATTNGIMVTSQDFSGVQSYKQVIQNGLTFIGNLSNSGAIDFRSMFRDLNQLTLNSLPLSGFFSRGVILPSLYFNNVNVAGNSSHGELQWTMFTRSSYAANNLHFGNYFISSTASDNALMWLPVWVGNYMVVHIRFGQLQINGTINYHHDTESHLETYTDSDGATHINSVDSIVATTGKLNLTITKEDGNPFNFAVDPKEQTADEVALVNYLTFLEMTAYDVWHTG